MSEPVPGGWPLVTAIMPIYNEEAFIAHSLGAVLEQDYPPDRLQILVVDGMSTDSTRAIIHLLPGAARVRVLDNPRRNQAAAMNIGIAAAEGEVIVRIDGHTVIAPDYVRQCVTLLRETGAQNVGGPMDPVGVTAMGRAIALAGKSPFAVPTAFHVSERAQFTDTVYMGAWPADVLRATGGYNEMMTPNEDYELNYRLRKAGGRLYFSPAIRSRYYGRQTLRALARQYYRYGQGKVVVLRIHPRSIRPRQLVAPLFVAGLAGGVLPGLLGGRLACLRRLRLLWLAAVALYAGLNAAFTVRAVRRSGEYGLAARVPLVFLTVHLAWGIGFWRELFRRGIADDA